MEVEALFRDVDKVLFPRSDVDERVVVLVNDLLRFYVDVVDLF